MFQQRLSEEAVNPLIEISFANMTPGTVNNNSTVGVSQACTLGAPGSAFPATFALGDQIEVFPSAVAACNGIVVSAAPGPTPGTAVVNFQNATGGNITPVGGSKYTFIVTRLPNTLVS